MKYLTLLLLAGLLLCTGCNRQSYAISKPVEDRGLYNDGERDRQQAAQDQRKLIYSASLGLTFLKADLKLLRHTLRRYGP